MSLPKNLSNELQHQIFNTPPPPPLLINNIGTANLYYKFIKSESAHLKSPKTTYIIFYQNFQFLPQFLPFFNFWLKYHLDCKIVIFTVENLQNDILFDCLQEFSISSLSPLYLPLIHFFIVKIAFKNCYIEFFTPKKLLFFANYPHISFHFLPQFI